MLRGAAVVWAQRPRADCLGEMAEELPVRVDRAGDKAAAMQTEEYSILSASLRNRPQRRHAACVGVDVVDAIRLGRQDSPSLDHVPPLVQRHFRVRCRGGYPVSVEARYLIGLLAQHRLVSPFRGLGRVLSSTPTHAAA